MGGAFDSSTEALSHHGCLRVRRPPHGHAAPEAGPSGCSSGSGGGCHSAVRCRIVRGGPS